MKSRLERVERKIQEEPSILMITSTHETTLDWLLDNQLVPAVSDCVCGNERKIGYDANQADRIIHRCNKCRKTNSIRNGTIFEGFRLTLIELVRIIFYHFLNSHSISRCADELGATRKSVSKVYTTIRQHLSLYEQLSWEGNMLGLVNQPNVMLDEDKVPTLEVSESVITHMNNEQMWVLGMYDRGTGMIRCTVIRDRTAPTLCGFIEQHVAKGARIYTDGWAAFRKLKELGYEHRVINHTVKLSSGLHSLAHIEKFWPELKKIAKYYECLDDKREASLEDLQSYVNVAVWIRNHKDEDIVKCLVEVLNFYYVF